MELWNKVSLKVWNDTDKDVAYVMDQMTTEGAKAPKGCSGGYCMGLASIWMRNLWVPRDYPFDPKTYEYHGTDWNAVAVQKIYDSEMASAVARQTQTGNTGDTYIPIRNAFKRAGLKINYGRSQFTTMGGIEGTGIYSVIAQQGDGVFLIALSGPPAIKNGPATSHAFAIANLGGEWWRLFDANYGHFVMKGNAVFKAFLDYYISGQGTSYRFTYSGTWLSACATPA